MGAAGHSRRAGDPAGVAAHHLDDDDPVVRLGGGVKTVDRVAGDLHGGIEAEGVVGAGEVVVDRLGDADHRHLVGRQAAGDPERVLAADGDQSVEAKLLHARGDERGAVAAVLVGVGAGGAEDRPATRQQARNLLHPQLASLAGQDAGPAVAQAKEGMVTVLDALADYAADDRVEAGTVAAAGENADPRHRLIVLAR